MIPTDNIAAWGVLFEGLILLVWLWLSFCLYQLDVLEDEKPAPLSATMPPDEEADALPFGPTPPHHE